MRRGRASTITLAAASDRASARSIGTEYGQAIDGVALFLEGRGEELLPAMQAQMDAAAEALDFERAARLRDEIRRVEHVLERQKIVSGKGYDADVLASRSRPEVTPASR